MDVAKQQPPNGLDHVWSCQALGGLDDAHLPYVWSILLQGMTIAICDMQFEDTEA